jgi:hypothetical protein
MSIFLLLPFRKCKKTHITHEGNAMKTYSFLKAAFAAAVVSLLAACGGGDDAAPDVAWASPAVFVTPGASSKVFALQGCSGGYGGEGIEGYEGNFYNVSLSIASNGDVSLSASTTTTGTVSVLWNMAYADAHNVTWSIDGNTSEPSYGLSMYTSSRSGSASLGVYYESEEDSYLSVNRSSNESGLGISCETISTPLALQVAVNQARAAKNLGTAAGVTTFDDYNVEEGRIEGGNAFWLNGNGSEQYDYMRFNLGTGELASSSSSTGTYSSISLSLPSTSDTYGVYGEALARNTDGFFDYKDAKTICLGKESETSGYFFVSATAFGNKFMPSGGRFMMPRGLEAPQGPGPGGCGGFDT